MSPDIDRRGELRRLIDEQEAKLEVSGLEKCLSHIAILMGLYVKRVPETETSFRDRIGLTPYWSDLSISQRAWLAKRSHAMNLGKRRILTFWMWRSWLLQKDLGVERPRNALEWYSLPPELSAERKRLIQNVEQLGEDLLLCANELPAVGGEAAYMLGQISGSPLAILKAAEYLLKARQQELALLSEKVLAEYGFGSQHRPNKRFDRHAERNIETFFLWKHDDKSETFTAPFFKSEKGLPAARDAAIKCASRFEAQLPEYENLLIDAEKRSAIPTLFFARRLTGD